MYIYQKEFEAIKEIDEKAHMAKFTVFGRQNSIDKSSLLKAWKTKKIKFLGVGVCKGELGEPKVYFLSQTWDFVPTRGGGVFAFVNGQKCDETHNT